ncbi:MAG: MazG family protein [Oliverpabstia sp.]
MKKYTFSDLQNIVKTLRGENGCPWDQVQTHQSLERCMIEEAYEAVEGIHLYAETGDGENLCEELGDVLLQVIFHSQLAEEENIFSLDDVIQGICEKMIHRHPHVFGEGQAKAELPNWDEMKKEEKKGKRDRRSELEAIPRAFPALIRAEKVQKKLVKGDYCQTESLEEICKDAENRLKTLEEGSSISGNRAEEKIGELLYQICRIADYYGVHSEEALAAVVDSRIWQFSSKAKQE